ncbi:MAG: response regulator receiver domain [Pontibacterium sp.]
MSTFDQYCRDVVDEYVQTVLIIDDGAGLSNTLAGGDEAEIIEEPLDGFDPMAEALQPKGPRREELEDQNEQVTHPLNTLSLTNAFYERGIVAGLYQPKIDIGQSVEDFASKAMKVSATADVIILDWMLVDHDASYSIEIVKQILQHDKNNGGRLRTIVVYTGETNLHKLCNDLWGELRDENLDKPAEYQISSEHLNIVFYNKPDAVNVVRPVSEEDLPEKALQAFAALVNGLVPAFAMKATSTVRQCTGALLAKFSSDLDSGYLAHRALLPDPQDSEVLMLENYSSYLRNVLALAQVDRKTLGYDTLKLWVEEKYDSRYKKAKITGDGTHCKEITIRKKGALESLEYGFTKGKEGLFKAIQYETSSKRAKKIVDVLANLERVVGAFGSYENEAKKSSQALACITAFRRTFRDLRVGHPYLTQGTLIKSIDEGTYLVCVMPKCDTARVKKARKFSFARLTPSDGVFDLVAPDINTKDTYVHLRTNFKFYELEHIVFKATASSKVEAVDDQDKLVFESEPYNKIETNRDKEVAENQEAGKKYLWIGDLEDLDVQTKVSSIVGDFNRIGVDEVEYLRRRKVQLN